MPTTHEPHRTPGQAIPYNVRISAADELAALERVRVAGGHRTGRQAVRAAILAADPGAGVAVPPAEALAQADPMDRVVALWLLAQIEHGRGAPSRMGGGCTAAEALALLEPIERFELVAALADAVGGTLGLTLRVTIEAGPALLDPRTLGTALGRLSGRKDSLGRWIAHRGFTRGNVVRWGVVVATEAKSGPVVEPCPICLGSGILQAPDGELLCSCVPEGEDAPEPPSAPGDL